MTISTTTEPHRRRPKKIAGITLTYSGTFWRQVATLATVRSTNIRALARELVGREALVNARPLEEWDRRRAADLPESEADVRTHTLTFPAPIYERMRAQAEVHGGSIRELLRRTFKAEIEAAIRKGEVSGPLFAGVIGQDPHDLVQPQFARLKRKSS